MMPKLESVTLVSRDLQKQKWKQIPSSKEIRHYFKKFKETGSVCDTPKSGRPSLEQENIDIIAGIYVQKPLLSLRIVANKTGCSCTTVHSVVSSYLDLFPH